MVMVPLVDFNTNLKSSEAKTSELFSFLRTSNLHYLLNNQVQRLALDIVGSFIVDFFAFTAAGDKTAGFKELQVVGNCRACHAHEDRDISYALLTVAEKPENLNPATVTKLSEYVGNSLKISLFEGFFQRFYIIFISVMMGEQFFGHYFFSLHYNTEYIITQ